MCFTTGKMLRMSSSVNTVLGSESKWYSLKSIWRRDWDELAIRVKEMHRHCQKIMSITNWYTWTPVLMVISLSRVILCSLHLSTASSTLPLPERDEIPLVSNHSTASICVQRTGHSPGQAVMVVLLSLSFDCPPKVSRSEVGPGGHSAAHGCTTPPSPTPASRS